jgi:alcohol dehydrogenase (NADP+)
MKLEYFDLVMMNCPTSPPPPPPPEPVEGEPAEEEKPERKRQSMMDGWKMLEACQEKSMCRSLGVANFTIQALVNLYPFTTIKPAVNQVESHPYLIQKNMYEFCKKVKMVMIAYCPLMRGGKDQKQPLGDKLDYQTDAALKELSIKYAKSIQQIILNYQICRGVGVIPKTEKVDHLNDNFNITDFQLLEEDVNTLEKLDKEGKAKVYQLKNLPLWRGEDPLC